LRGANDDHAMAPLNQPLPRRLMDRQSPLRVEARARHALCAEHGGVAVLGR
jgi:hypothetical protein